MGVSVCVCVRVEYYLAKAHKESTTPHLSEASRASHGLRSDFRAAGVSVAIASPGDSWGACSVEIQPGRC